MTQMLNYSAHAIEDILSRAPKYRQNRMGIDASQLENFASILRAAIKYVLPKEGAYISQGAGLPPGSLPQRLPFPRIALEVPMASIVDTPMDFVSSRRVIICQEMNLVDDGKFMSTDENTVNSEGFAMAVVSYIDSARTWLLQDTAAYVRYDLPSLGAGLSTYNETFPSVTKASYSFSVIPILPESHKLGVDKYGAEAAQRASLKDLAREVSIAFEFLQVLACRNVTEVEHAPPEKLNKHRRASGKLLFDVFRTLTVGDVQIGMAASNSSDSDGFKVREHLRCGHIRRLSDHQIWIHDTVVAAGSDRGRVTKTYQIKA
ncbi:MAG: hypothetical protein ACRYG4_17170 [Janthinobacterium lividum]